MKEIIYIHKEMESNSTGVFKDREGTTHYLLLGEYHREDGPAYQAINGYKEWRFYGELHRLDGPAIYWKKVKKNWYYYSYIAKNEEEFYDSQWRKRIEIKRFL